MQPGKSTALDSTGWNPSSCSSSSPCSSGRCPNASPGWDSAWSAAPSSSSSSTRTAGSSSSTSVGSSPRHRSSPAPSPRWNGPSFRHLALGAVIGTIPGALLASALPDRAAADPHRTAHHRLAHQLTDPRSPRSQDAGEPRHSIRGRRALRGHVGRPPEPWGPAVSAYAVLTDWEQGVLRGHPAAVPRRGDRLGGGWRR
jgi:hypothetical protein